MQPYRTPGCASAHEIPKIKGSRFIASIAPITDEQDARSHLLAVRKLHHAARHHCQAWRLGADGSITRSSDDGEPSGSAGRPILQAMAGADLTFLSVVVTRYFGGTKLGVGGLVRAYGGAAAAALDRVEVKAVVPTTRVRVRLDYEHLGVLETFLAREGVARPEGEYAEQVCFLFDIPCARAAAFAERLIDQSNGRIKVVLA